MDDARYPTLRAVLASALISTALTLPMSGALAQMSDMKKMPGMNDSDERHEEGQQLRTQPARSRP